MRRAMFPSQKTDQQGKTMKMLRKKRGDIYDEIYTHMQPIPYQNNQLNAVCMQMCLFPLPTIQQTWRISWIDTIAHITVYVGGMRY